MVNNTINKNFIQIDNDSNPIEQSNPINQEQMANNLYNKTLLHPVFDRQMRIPNWNQKKIENQIVLCLGCGGLGCSVALGCARMGVKKIILVDYDVVESHNLNRQLLFTKKHVGRSKVECAKEILLDLHVVGDTEIDIYHIDAKDQWPKIVELSNTCTVIFNLIDQGFEWDVAVQSLALVRRVPFLSGGTFQTTTTIDFCKPNGAPCFLCMSYNMNENLSQLRPENICQLQDLNFLKRDAMPIGASNIYVASTCSNLLLASWAEWLNHPDVDINSKTDSDSDSNTNVNTNTDIYEGYPNRGFLYMNNLEIAKWKVEPEKNCILCSNIIERLKEISYL